jgi:hypothetical protein
MITFSKLEKKGHLGNQLFQIASTIGIAKSNGQEFGFPIWSYSTFFKNELPAERLENFEVYNEETFHFTAKKFDNKNYDLEGWFQSEKYFDLALIKKYFEFKENFLDDLKRKHQIIFEKKTILISIRRGDFVDHPDYFQLPINYYLNALIHNFPDWRGKNLVILSDDVDYCKFHFSFLENVFFADNLTAIEQLAIASLCDDFIISNSTFSWWCAWLGEKESSKIIRPLHYFTESKNEIDNDKDYFPERWKIYNHLDVKIDLGKTVIVLKKANSILEEYVAHYFRFGNENRKLYLNSIDENLNYKECPLLIINDCIFPPLSIYYTYIEQKKYIGILKGNYLNISKYLQYPLFKKQFDFGLFTKIMNSKKTKVNRKERLFVFIPKFEHEFDIFKNVYLETFDILGFIELKSFAGKIKGILELKYFYVTKKRNLIVFMKTKIKKILKLKK